MSNNPTPYLPYEPFFKSRKRGGTVTLASLKPFYQHAFGKVMKRFASEQQAAVWLQEKLGFANKDKAIFDEVINAEQADSVLLAILALEAGQGFVVADKTGIGKGRILASLVRYALSHQKKVLFVTEKGNLFSDFWRDLADTDTVKLIDKKRLLLLHSEADISQNGTTLVYRLKKTDMQAVIQNRHTDGFDMVMTTYSQISGEIAQERMAFLEKFADKNTLVIFDEFHNAIGDTFAAKEKISKNAFGVVDSSATFMKEVKHLKAFCKHLNLPDGMDKMFHALECDASGFAIDSITAAMVASGSMLKREHPTEINVETVTLDAESNKKVTFYLDSFADFLRKVFDFREECCVRLKKQPENGAKWSKWAARIDRGARALLVLAEVDFLCDRIELAISENKKCVVALRSTFASIIDEQYKIQRKLAERKGVKPEYHFTFNRFLISFLEDVRDDFSELEREEAFEFDLKALYQLANAFPKLELSVIDTIKRTIQQRTGKEPLEISGRFNHVIKTPTGSDDWVTRGFINRNAIIDAFNNGDANGLHDVLILTSAGSTGLSIHAAANFKDQRVRKLLELEVTPKVIEREQIYGRVNRYNQIRLPEIESLVSSHVLSQRLFAKESSKQKTARRLTGSNHHEVLDFDNPAAEMAARNFLRQHDSAAKLLGLRANKVNLASNDGTLGSVLLRRAFLLPEKMRENVLSLLTNATLLYQHSLMDFQKFNVLDTAHTKFQTAKQVLSLSETEKNVGVRDELKSLSPKLILARFEARIENMGETVQADMGFSLPKLILPDLRIFDEEHHALIKRNAKLIEALGVGCNIEFNLNGSRIVGLINAVEVNEQYPFAEQQGLEILLYKGSDTLKPVSQVGFRCSAMFLLLNDGLRIIQAKTCTAKGGNILTVSKRIPKIDSVHKTTSVLIGHPLLLEWAATALNEAQILMGTNVGHIVIDGLVYPALHIPESAGVKKIDDFFVQWQPIFNQDELFNAIKRGEMVKTADDKFAFLWKAHQTYPFGQVRLKLGMWENDEELTPRIKSYLCKPIKIENGYEYFKIVKLSEINSIARAVFNDKYHQLIAFKGQ